MKAPDGARAVAIRGKGIMGQRVAVVIGDRVHLWRGCDPNGIVAWNQTGRPLDTIECGTCEAGPNMLVIRCAGTAVRQTGGQREGESPGGE
ncbi:MAG TPA: hypothetical protein VNG35_16505 [Gemmatimonadales bacterium]|nr:hypothetical protein [Gemmatimonadales bacterium]